jgi:hypothetical protein
VRGELTYAETLEVAARAHVLLLVDTAGERAGMFLPSKLIDYLMFARPILGLTPDASAPASLLRRLGCPCVSPEDADAIATVLQQLLLEHEHGALGVAPQFATVAAAYAAPAIARQFAGVLATVLPHA